MGLGLGLTHYIPLALYIAGFVCTFCALLYNPAIGVFFLFPLLPYAYELDKMQVFPLGKNYMNIIIMIILIGWYIRKSGVPEKTEIGRTVLFLFLTSLMGLVNGLLSKGFDLNYIVDWKDYIMLPLIWFLTVRIIRDKKTLKWFTLALIVGILGFEFYYISNMRGMDFSHFSEKVRDAPSGMFMYLGANHYGAYFAHFVFILIGLFLMIKSRLQKLGLAALAGIAVYCMAYSYSRGAYIAFVAGLLVLGILKEKFLLVVLVAFLIFWKAFVPVSVVERVEMTHSADGQLEVFAAERIILWQKAWDMFLESPVWGKGFNSFSFDGYSDTHNYYLKMLAEQGVMGLATFVFLLIAALKMGWRLYKESADEVFQGLGLGFALCVIAVMITNFFGNRWSFLSLGAYFWAFMGIVTRALLIEREERDTAVEEPGEAAAEEV